MALPEGLVEDPGPLRNPDEEIDYASSRGLALHGTNRHRLAVHLADEALRRHLLDDRDVFVVEGDNSRRLIPDLMVVRGIDRRTFRRSYKTWEEPVPQFVLEVASRSTVDRDRGFKMERYRRLGVREYWQLDQEGGLLPRELMGHRLRRGRYEELAPGGRVGLARQYDSWVLGLSLRTAIHDGGLTAVFRDLRTGEDAVAGKEVNKVLRNKDAIIRDWQQRAEAAEGRAEAAERRKQEEAEARRRAEDLVAELRARLRTTGDDPLE